MRIKVAKGLYVDSNTLFRIEWRKFYPALILHEKYEKKIKWTLRIIAIISIGLSIYSFEEWYHSLLVTLVILAIEQFFEKAGFEYTTIIFQPLPKFELELDQWVTNGFLIPKVKNKTVHAHFGPTYLDEEYGTKFFNYIRSWINDNQSDDKENTVIISLVIEPNETYTTYIYANPGRKRLDYLFKFLEASTQTQKYGKKQQKFVAQLFYWNTLDFKDGYSIKNFLSFKEEDDPFYFTPSIYQPFNLPPKFLTDLSIKKYNLKIRNRKDLKKNEPEFLFDPTKYSEEFHTKDSNQIQQKETNIFSDILIAFNKNIDIGFLPNQVSSPGVINLCFDDCTIPFAAYEHLVIQANKQEVVIRFEEEIDGINLSLKLKSINKELKLKKLKYDKEEFKKFSDIKGGGSPIMFTVGYTPANKRHIILDKEVQPLMVKLDFDE